MYIIQLADHDTAGHTARYRWNDRAQLNLTVALRCPRWRGAAEFESLFFFSSHFALFRSAWTSTAARTYSLPTYFCFASGHCSISSSGQDRYMYEEFVSSQEFAVKRHYAFQSIFSFMFQKFLVSIYKACTRCSIEH